MSNDLTLKEARPLDEFSDWTDEVESHDEQASERSIVGQRIRFTNEGHWTVLGGGLTKPLIAVNVRRTVVKWSKEKMRAPETIFLKAGEKIPDLVKRNEETPRSEWIEGFDGKPKGPWEAQHVVYLIDPTSIDQYSFPTATVGGGIAVRELIDRIVWMRRFRGNATYPVVQLTTRLMKTKYAPAGRPRPHFEIVDWVRFDTDHGGMLPAGDARQLPSPQPTNASPEPSPEKTEKLKAALDAIGMQTVEPPSLKEETRDEIPW